MVGRAVFDGAAAAATTGAVAAETAGELDPEAFVAVTATVMVWPVSDTAGT